MNHSRKAFFNSGKKGIAWLTAVLFAFVNTAMAQPSTSLSVDAMKDSPSLSTLANLHLPESLGGVESTLLSSHAGRPFVAVIQDAHSVLDAQTNIQEIIQYLQTQYGIRVIALEGAAGKLDPTLFRTFPDPFVKKKIFEGYLRRGELTGAESAAVMNNEEAQYYGIEDWKLYESHYVAYLRAAEKKESVLKQLGTLRSRLDQERLKVYSPKVNQFHENLEKFERENVYLLELLNFLGDIEGTRERLDRFPDLEKLFRSYDFETDTAQDKSTLEARIRQMADTFKMNYLKRMNIKQEMIFHRNYQAFVTGQTEGAVFLKYLIETGESFGVKARLSPSLLKVLGHHETLATIKGTRLFEELQNLIAETEEALITAPQEKELAEKYRRLKLLENLAKLELSRSQFDEYQKAPEMYASTLTLALSLGGRGKAAEGEPSQGRGEGAKLLGPAIEFYRLALERDQAFRRNLIQLLKEQKANAAIVIAGGFHSQGFEKSLKEEGLSFSIITPKIQSLEGQETYASVMQGNVSYKPYLRTTFYDAFARDSSIKLVNELSEPDFRKSMKLWRDEIIRKLSHQGKLVKAGEYTRYIDLIYEVYHEKFGQGNRTARSREEILEAVDQELKDFTNQSVGRQWQKLEWQINQLGAGLKALVAQKELRFDRIASLVNQVKLTQPATLGTMLTLNPRSPPISEMSPVIKTLILKGKLIPETDRIPLIPAPKAVLPVAVNNRSTAPSNLRTTPMIRLGNMEITQGELPAVRSEVRASEDAFGRDPDAVKDAAKRESSARLLLANDISLLAEEVSAFYQNNKKLKPEPRMDPAKYLKGVPKKKTAEMRSVLNNIDYDLYMIGEGTKNEEIKRKINDFRGRVPGLKKRVDSGIFGGRSGSTLDDVLDQAEIDTKVDKKSPAVDPDPERTSKLAAEKLAQMGVKSTKRKLTEPSAQRPGKKNEEVYSLVPQASEEPPVSIYPPGLVSTTIDRANLTEQPAPQEATAEPSTEAAPAPEDEVGLTRVGFDSTESTILNVGNDERTDAELRKMMEDIEEEDTQIEEPEEVQPAEEVQMPEEPAKSQASEALKNVRSGAKQKTPEFPPAILTSRLLENFRSRLIEDLDARDTAIVDKVSNRNQFKKGSPRITAFGLTALMATGVFVGVTLVTAVFTGLWPLSTVVGGITAVIFGVIIGFFVRPDLTIEAYRKRAKQDFESLLKEQKEGLEKLLTAAKDGERNKDERLVFMAIFAELSKRLEIAVLSESRENPSEDLAKIQNELRQNLTALKSLKEDIQNAKASSRPLYKKLWRRFWGGTIRLEYPSPQKQTRQSAWDADIYESIVLAVAGTVTAAVFAYFIGGFFVPHIGGLATSLATAIIVGIVTTLIIRAGIRENAARIAASRAKNQAAAAAAAHKKERDEINAEYKKIQNEINNNAALKTVLKAGIQGQPGEKLQEARTILAEARSNMAELERRGQKVGLRPPPAAAKIENWIQRIDRELANQRRVIVEVMKFARRLRLNGKELPDEFMVYVLDSMLNTQEGEIGNEIEKKLSPNYAAAVNKVVKGLDSVLHNMGLTRKAALEPLKVLLGTYSQPRSEVRLAVNFSDDDLVALRNRLNANPEVTIIVNELSREYRGRLDKAKNRLGENRKAILSTIRQASDIVDEVFSKKFKEGITNELGWTVKVGLLTETDLEAVLWRVRAAAVGEAIAAITEADIELAQAVEGISDAALEAFQKQIRDALVPLKASPSNLGLNIVIVKPDNPADAVYVEFALSLLKEFIDTAEVLYASDQKPESGLRRLGFPVIQHRYNRADYQRDIHKINEAHQKRNGRFPDWFVTNGLQLPKDLRRLLTSLQSKLDLMPEKLKGPFVSAASALFKALNDLSEEQRRAILDDPTGEKLREFIEDRNLPFPNAFRMNNGVIIPMISGLIRDIKASQAAATAA